MTKSVFLPGLLAILLIPSIAGAQEQNKRVYDSAVEQKVLIDYCDRSGLEAGEFGTFFTYEYNEYKVNDSLAHLMADKLNDYKITIIFGSWCSDSQEQLPRFYKVLDEAGYDASQLTLIAVNRKKEALAVDISNFYIERVPTILIYKNGKEKGRIVETPQQTLEEDLWDIIR